MAAQDALDTEIQAFKNTPLLNGSDHVVRAGGLIAAFVRAKQGRKQDLVQPNGQNSDLFEQLHNDRMNSSKGRWHKQQRRAFGVGPGVRNLLGASAKERIRMV